jgi:hypothetical protein
MKETIMSKGQRGNKEAKKPKKSVPAPSKVVAPMASPPTQRTAVPPRHGK